MVFARNAKIKCLKNKRKNIWTRLPCVDLNHDDRVNSSASCRLNDMGIIARSKDGNYPFSRYWHPAPHKATVAGIEPATPSWQLGGLPLLYTVRWANLLIGEIARSTRLIRCNLSMLILYTIFIHLSRGNLWLSIQPYPGATMRIK